MLGSFGSIVFAVSSKKILTPDSISQTVAATWANIALTTGKPRKQFMGAKCRTVSLNITLRADLGVKPRKVMEELAEMVEAGATGRLIIGGKPVSPLPMVITSMSEAWDKIYSGGELFQATLSLSLEEYQ